jgi:hypothetical protein
MLFQQAIFFLKTTNESYYISDSFTFSCVPGRRSYGKYNVSRILLCFSHYHIINRSGITIINVHTVIRLLLFHPLPLPLVHVFNAVIAISTSLPFESILQLYYHIAASRSGGNHRCERSKG